MAKKPSKTDLDQLVAQRQVVSRDRNVRVTYLEDDVPIGDAQTPVGEGVQVAGLGLRQLAKVLRAGGERAPAQPNIVDDVASPPPREPAPSGTGERVDAPLGDTVETPSGERVETPASDEPPIIEPAPVSEERMLQQSIEREAMLEAGETAASPSPTSAQRAAGVADSPISTLPFDTESMQATVRAAAESTLTDTPSMTVQEIFERSVAIGVPERVAENIFRGVPLTSNVGGSQLAENLAGLLKLHDDSAAKLDDLFRQMADNQLAGAGQLELRRQMAYHDLILKQVKGVQVDVARSMNVFKRFQDVGGKMTPSEVREILDQAGGDASLIQLATDYLALPGRRGRNAVMETGLGKRTREAWMYVYQSNLLTSPDTHARNAASSLILGSMASVERLLSVPVGALRRVISPESGERYYMGQTLAEMYGIIEGMQDGFQFAAHALRTGERATYKGDVRVTPISAEKFSNVSVRTGNIVAGAADIATSVVAGMPMPISPVLGGLSDTGRELFRTPDLANTWTGKFLDGIGFLHSLPFRGVAGVDEGVGGVLARMNLNSEAYLPVNRAYDEALEKGATVAEAEKIAQDVMADFLHNRPKSMQITIDSARKQATLMDTFNRESRVSEAFWKMDQFFNHPLVKVYVPFGKTMLNLYSEGAARLPGLNLTSPRFFDEYNKGGKYRDLALTRVALGSAMASGMAYLTLQNKCTGTGPPDFSDRQILQQLGWQPYSCIFKSGELSSTVVDRISRFAEVSQGRGTLEGMTFVSYARLDPISQIMATGANVADAMKFHKGKPDDSDIMEVVRAVAFSNSEYIAEHPVATQIGDFMSILRTRQEDDGQKVLDIFARAARQYMDYSFTGTPVVGLANSSFVAKLETFLDPDRRSNMADQMDLPVGIRQMEEARARVMSRIPGLSAGVPVQHDNLGNPMPVKNRGLDNYWNWVPVLNVVEGESKATYETLADINHGISRPSSVWGGVALSATQYERYKYLYGNGIKLDLGITRIDGSYYGQMSLNEAIPPALDEYIRDANMSGEVVMIGDKQKFVDTLVSRYRKFAKLKMLGFDPEGTDDADLMAFMEDIGMPGSNIEFPELSAAIKKQQDFVRAMGR